VFKIDAGSNGTTTRIHWNSNQNTKYSYALGGINSEFLFVKYLWTTIAKLTVEHNNVENKGKLYRVGVPNDMANYSIKDMSANAVGTNPGTINGGFENIPFNDALSAFPNPFNNQLDVFLPYPTENQDVEVSLYDLQGRRIFIQNFGGGDQMVSIPTENISPGMYFLQARSGDRVESIKMLKQ
jgi:hypothetical protein